MKRLKRPLIVLALAGTVLTVAGQHLLSPTHRYYGQSLSVNQLLMLSGAGMQINCTPEKNSIRPFAYVCFNTHAEVEAYLRQ